MKEIKHTTEAYIYKNIDMLPQEDQVLMNNAIEAKNKAYAPYSKFSVGAALLLENGQIILGNNQENAAYPSGMCAERVAIWKAGSDFPGVTIKKLAIVASSSTYVVNKPISPCGACRQTLSEYEINQNSAIEILFMGAVGEVYKVDSIISLLPFSFDSSFV
ncbi:cytidine deaminase [Aquimarina hainanensis]|uniref:Cytidine deaminase n=1 Tax=Aquimarina hainanensis TaxID=1578017 RepID=A0ABW5N6N2_9FLAO|nr:cytidine deaminase [Aquimarina sp. TRL1]QKX05109.1 cytidine deaminase [Aquimarina sp. TRL1]